MQKEILKPLLSGYTYYPQATPEASGSSLQGWET